jgi:hypothetical protein
LAAIAPMQISGRFRANNGSFRRILRPNGHTERPPCYSEFVLVRGGRSRSPRGPPEMAEETFVEIPQPLHRGHFSQPNSSRISMEESMQTELRSLTDVHPYDANPRTNDRASSPPRRRRTQLGQATPAIQEVDGFCRS